MTDKELIQALRCCSSEPNCSKCADECVFYNGFEVTKCIPKMGTEVADHLEALLAEVAEMDRQIQIEICKRVDVERENERLKAKIPQWVSVSERLPELVKLDVPEGDDWRESKRVFAVTTDGECTVATFWRVNERFGWTDEVTQTRVTVKAWMTPEPPSTEGVE